MMAKTHTSFAFTLALLPVIAIPDLKFHILSDVTFYDICIIFLGISFGSLFPDIDEPNSKISRSSIFSFLFSWFIRLLGTKHRGITHKFIFIVDMLFILGFLYFYNFNNNVFFIFSSAFLFGIFAHHLGDMLSGSGRNKGGIYDYFYPFTGNKIVTIFPRFLRCKIGGLKEYLYFVSFNIFNFYALYNLFGNDFILVLNSNIYKILS